MIDELKQQLHRAADVDVPVDALAAIVEAERRIRRGTRQRRAAIVAGIALVGSGAVVLRTQAHEGHPQATIAAERSPASDVVGHVIIPKLHVSVDVRHGEGALAQGLQLTPYNASLCTPGAAVLLGQANLGLKPFNSLGQLRTGDLVRMSTASTSCTLAVHRTRLVAATDTDAVKGEVVLIAHWPKGHDGELEGQRLVVTLGAVLPPKPLLPPSIQIPSIDVAQTLLRQSASLPAEAAMERGPLVSGAPLCTRGTVLIYGHRTTYGHPFVDLDQLKAGDPVRLISLTRTCTLSVVRVFVTLPGGTDQLKDHTYLVTQTPKYSASHRLMVQLSDP